MNEIDPAVNADTRRAEQARAALLRDIREIRKIGDSMIEKTETAITKAPVLLGIGAAGVALVGIVFLASRRSTPKRFPRVPEERSFIAEAVRGAALSALGILSGRITQQLLRSAFHDTRERQRVSAQVPPVAVAPVA